MTAPRRDPRVLAIVAVAAISIVLRTIGVSGQPLTGDDVGVGVTAENFASTGWPETTMWNHPRLRDLLVSASVAVLGKGAWGLKLWSVVFGALSAPVLALLVVVITGSALAALVAGALLAIDPLHVDFSRQAINDVYLSLFPVAAVAMLLRYRVTPRPAWILGAGLLLGLGISSKWSAVFPVGAAAALVLVQRLRAEATRAERAAEVALFAGALAALPAALYLVTFYPWFGRGHGLAEWMRLQVAMGTETATHTGYPGTKLPGYPGEIVSALRWFVAPTWYVDYIPRIDRLVPGVGNPVAWLATLPAFAWASLVAWRERGGAAATLVLLFSAAYLPFVLVSRPIWPNSAVAVLPFAFALVGWAAARLHARTPLPVRLWGAAALVSAALLWLPAVGVSAPLPDAVVRLLVSPAALDRATH